MGSEQQNNLIFLRVSTKDVRAYPSNIENTSDNGLKLHVQSPQIIAPLSDFPVSWNTMSAPLYDYTQQLILFATYGKKTPLPSEVNFSMLETYSNTRDVDLWRVGPHFSLASVEPVKPLHSTQRSPPGLVLHGGLIGISIPRVTYERDSKQVIPMMAQNGKDSSSEDAGWSAVQYNSNTKNTSGHDTRLFQSPDPEIKYVYHMKIHKIWMGHTYQVFIEQMRASEYAKLASSKNSLWTSYEVTCGGAMYDVPAYAFTRSQYEDNTPTKRRLYLFQLIHDGSAIEVSYLNLRGDGSVDSPNTAVKATQQAQIQLPQPTKDNQQLQAVDLADGRIMLWWLKCVKANRQYDFTPAAIVTNVDRHGALDGPWKDVSLEFETPVVDYETQIRWGAVLVPKEFNA